jgi:flagellar assembly factor FliW
LLGFEKIKRYALIAEAGEEPFQWLQMLEEPGMAFLVLSPFVIKPDYRPDLSQEDVNFIGLQAPEDALILNIVTLRPNGVSTMNLKGPVVLHRESLRGKQCILTNAAEYPLQFPLPAAE